MVETWEYTEEDKVFAFGEAVIAAVQRTETHMCFDSGVSRSACPCGSAPDVTAKGIAPPLFSINGSSIEQRGYKKVHWENRDSAGGMKRIGSTMVESSVLFLVASVPSLEENETSVFPCSGDYYFIRQPIPPPSQSSGVSHMKLQKRNGTCWLQADRRVTVDDKSSANTLAGFSSVQMAPIEEGGAASSTDVAVPLPNTAEAGKTSKESVSIEQGQPLRAAEPGQWATKVRAKPIPETPKQRQRDRYSRAHTPTAGSLVSSVCVWKGR